MDLICVGDVMLDVHARFGPLARGGDVHGQVALQPAGTSANAAVWGAWAGAHAAVVGAVGEDLVGELLIRSLREAGVETGWIRRRGPRTGTMLVALEDGERSMVADRGANALLRADDLPVLEAAAVLVSGYLLLQDPGHEVALAALHGARTPLLAIEAASWPLVAEHGADRFFDETASATAVLANDREAQVLTGSTGVDACRALGERYRIAAVKRGRDGATLVVDGDRWEAPGEGVAEIDATGAGDAFDGVLLATLAAGRDPADALAAACHAGALVVAGERTWPSREAGA